VLTGALSASAYSEKVDIQAYGRAERIHNELKNVYKKTLGLATVASSGTLLFLAKRSECKPVFVLTKLFRCHVTVLCTV
jgi:hypothetical protein